MRARHDSIGEAIRRNRREQGHTQESLAFELGVDRTTVGKWERDRASPSPRNMHTLVLRGLLEDSTVRHGSRTSPGWQALPPALAERVTSTFGCRKSEILTLRWEHVGLEAGELRLPDAQTGARVVPLSPSAVKVLAALRRAPGNPWVIPGRQPGTHMRALGDAWEVIRTRTDLEGVRIHDLMHSFASRALALGESLPMIGKLLGHSQMETTSRYAHLARDSVHQSAARIADSLAAEILGDDWRSHMT